jgi:hypothetical protein
MSWGDRWAKGSFWSRFTVGYAPMMILLGVAWLIGLHQYLNLLGFLVIWLLSSLPVVALFELMAFLRRGFINK